MKNCGRFDPIDPLFPYGFHVGGLPGRLWSSRTSGRRWTLLACLLVLLIACLASQVAAKGLDSVFKNAPDIPWNVTAADSIIYDPNTDAATALGNVVVQKKDIRLSADEVRLRPDTRTAFAKGNVRVDAGGDEFTGQRLELNWKKQTGAFYNGTLFLKKNNFHIRAKKIEKTGPLSYSAENVLVTTCDGDDPAWELAGKKFDITINGYGVIRDALFKVKNVPVFYSPLLVFPAKRSRQTGLLTPQFDLYSQRKGFQYTQPFYWDISDSSDATFYVQSMGKRGQRMGAEYRYFLSDTNRGVIMFDYLKDRKVDDGIGNETADWGYSEDRYLRPNSDRYWFRMKQNLDLGLQSDLKLDLDIVSDQDYLTEFRNSYLGYQDSQQDFYDVFGRGLDNYSDTVRKNQLAFSKQWNGYGLDASTLWWDDVIARRWLDTDKTVQSLPVVYFDSYRKPLLGSRFYSSLETQANYFYTKDGDRAFRIDLHPRLYLPYRIGGIVSVEPSVGVRETLWQMDRMDASEADMKRTQSRELYDFNLDLSSDIYRVFRPDWKDIEGLKHDMRFQVEYAYTPTVNQDAYPYFDGLDRIDGENLITYSIVNTVTTRHRSNPGTDASDYRQALRFELSQSFDINKKQTGDPEPFSPIDADLRLNLGTWSQLQADAAWSTYSGAFVSQDVAYRFSDQRGDSFLIQHHYAQSLRETIYAAATLSLTDRIKLYSHYERNIKDDLEIGSGFGLVYNAQCWSVEADYQKDESDASVHFVITFYGLGNMGGSAQHNQGIPAWAGAGL